MITYFKVTMISSAQRISESTWSTDSSTGNPAPMAVITASRKA